MLPKHETTHRGDCKSCPFNCSQDVSAEDYLPLRSSALFPSKTCFCPSKAIIENKLLIILICGVFVYWSSAGTRYDHTHFPLCKSHLCAVMQSRGMWTIFRCPVLVRESENHLSCWILCVQALNWALNPHSECRREYEKPKGRNTTVATIQFGCNK